MRNPHKAGRAIPSAQNCDYSECFCCLHSPFTTMTCIIKINTYKYILVKHSNKFHFLIVSLSHLFPSISKLHSVLPKPVSNFLYISCEPRFILPVFKFPQNYSVCHKGSIFFFIPEQNNSYGFPLNTLLFSYIHLLLACTLGLFPLNLFLWTCARNCKRAKWCKTIAAAHYTVMYVNTVAKNQRNQKRLYCQLSFLLICFPPFSIPSWSPNRSNV